MKTANKFFVFFHALEDRAIRVGNILYQTDGDIDTLDEVRLIEDEIKRENPTFSRVTVQNWRKL